MFPRLSIKSSGYPKVDTRVEVAYFIDKPGSLYLHGLDRKRKRGDTFGHIHQARTAEQCFIDGRYDYSNQQHDGQTYDTGQLPFAEWPPKLREKLKTKLRKRLHEVFHSPEMARFAQERRNMCAAACNSCAFNISSCIF
jgi:hypothetical protein